METDKTSNNSKKDEDIPSFEKRSTDQLAQEAKEGLVLRSTKDVLAAQVNGYTYLIP